MTLSTSLKFLMAGTALMVATLPVAARANDKDDGSTTVQLSAEARRMVAQDRVQATLAIEATGKTAEGVQKDINAKMQAAKKLYDAVADVKPTTGGYNVYKDYEPEPTPKKGEAGWTPAEREAHAFWRGSQEIQLDGVKSDELLALIAGLQKEGFAMRGLNFYMSRAAEDSVKDALIVEALGNIQARAKNIQQALGMKTIRYARIDLGDQGVRPMPMARGAMMMKAEMASADAMPAPVGEAGETEVVINVSAEVKLK